MNKEIFIKNNMIDLIPIAKKLKEHEKEPEDEEYLDKEFPKGETKFRGQAMVLLALARQEGRNQGEQEFEKERDRWVSERKRMAKLLFDLGVTSW